MKTQRTSHGTGELALPLKGGGAREGHSQPPISHLCNGNNNNLLTSQSCSKGGCIKIDDLIITIQTRMLGYERGAVNSARTTGTAQVA